MDNQVLQQISDEVTENSTKDEVKMLQMKYGLVEPILTPSEKYLIQKEERKLAGK